MFDRRFEFVRADNCRANSHWKALNDRWNRIIKRERELYLKYVMNILSKNMQDKQKPEIDKPDTKKKQKSTN